MCSACGCWSGEEEDGEKSRLRMSAFGFFFPLDVKNQAKRASSRRREGTVPPSLSTRSLALFSHSSHLQARGYDRVLHSMLVGDLSGEVYVGVLGRGKTGAFFLVDEIARLLIRKPRFWRQSFSLLWDPNEAFETDQTRQHVHRRASAGRADRKKARLGVRRSRFGDVWRRSTRKANDARWRAMLAERVDFAKRTARALSTMRLSASDI